MEWRKTPATENNRSQIIGTLNTDTSIIMRLFNYCTYFLYLARNWNPLLAVYVLYHEVKGERKYHIHTTGIDELQGLEAKGIDISHATMYMPLNYYVLEKLMEKSTQYPHNKTFLDIGCGKGRVLAVAAHFGFEEITGIDFSKELCEDAVKTTDSCKEKFPAAVFTIINNDAFYYELPKNITTILLFNPFDEVIMSGVIVNIARSQQLHPRTIRVLYANPVHKSLFIDDGFTEIYHIKKLKYLDGIILEKKWNTDFL
jgi:SAM-dependent methyltransferase